MEEITITYVDQDLDNASSKGGSLALVSSVELSQIEAKSEEKKTDVVTEE